MKNILKILIIWLAFSGFYPEDNFIDPTGTYELEILKYKNKLDSINNWTKIDTLEVFETTEGGVIYYYYLDDELNKIECQYYGETGKNICYYYLKNNELSFSIHETYKYNRPIYYDSLDMIQNIDSVFFDINKTKKNTDFFYYENGEIYQYTNSLIKSYDSTEFSKQDILKHFNEVLSKIGKK